MTARTEGDRLLLLYADGLDQAVALPGPGRGWGKEHEDARLRIVACVNACAGFTDKQLADFGTGTFPIKTALKNAVTKQTDAEIERNRLRTVLRQLAPLWDQACPQAFRAEIENARHLLKETT